MQAHAPERVAEYQSIGYLRVEKWPDAEPVPRTQQALLPAIPDREREVADQVTHTVFAPARIRTENQFLVTYRSARITLPHPEACHQFGARVDSRIGGDPG